MSVSGASEGVLGVLVRVSVRGAGEGVEVSVRGAGEG